MQIHIQFLIHHQLYILILKFKHTIIMIYKIFHLEENQTLMLRFILEMMVQLKIANMEKLVMALEILIILFHKNVQFVIIHIIIDFQIVIVYLINIIMFYPFHLLQVILIILILKKLKLIYHQFMIKDLQFFFI